MGHLLRRKGIEIKGEIGSMQRFLGVALANVANPKLVQDCHAEYLDAGAMVITTNNYSCVPSAIKLSDGSGAWSEVKTFIAAAGKCATNAVTLTRPTAQLATTGKPPAAKIAGCLPPLHESYRSDLVASNSELSMSYVEIVNEIKLHSDLLLCETMSSIRESKIAAQAASNASTLPVWVSWTLHEDGSGNLRSGESITEAIQQLGEIERLEACLLNCCSHESIVEAIPALREELVRMGRSEVRIGAYANGFVTVHSTLVDCTDPQKEYLDLSPDDYLLQVRKWIELGADIVGGCCGVFPEHVEVVAKEVERINQFRE